MPSLTDKNKPNKDAPNADQEVVNWWSDYIRSPKYKERLSAFYKYPDYIQKQRSDLLSTLKITDNPQTRSRYWEGDNELRISPLQISALGATRPEVVAHEMSHVTGWNSSNRAAALSPKEELFVAQRNKTLSPSSLERYKNMSKESGKSISDLLPEAFHDAIPAENVADIQSLRFLLKRRSIYDAGKEDITPDIIRKAASDPIIRKSFIWKRLKEAFDEKELTEIMNKVAASKSTKKQNIA